MQNLTDERVEELFKENRVCCRLPTNWDKPDWKEYDRIHNWRNHINSMVKEIWDTFSDQQKKILAMVAEVDAMQEDWD